MRLLERNSIESGSSSFSSSSSSWSRALHAAALLLAGRPAWARARLSRLPPERLARHYDLGHRGRRRWRVR
eukprot:3102212-Prymnesium_polylepis.1